MFPPPKTFTPANLENHVLGGLVGAALGDAMGAATEQHQIDEILADHGTMLRRLVPPPLDTFSHSDIAGLVTDDSSQMFALAQALIATDGELGKESGLQAVSSVHGLPHVCSEALSYQVVKVDGSVARILPDCRKVSGDRAIGRDSDG
jgi:hypothetical protein